MAPIFTYGVRNEDGEKIKGELRVKDRAEAAHYLRKKGYYVIHLKAKTGHQHWIKNLTVSKRVKAYQLAAFSHEFAIMLEAGINPVKALQIMEKQLEPSFFKKALAGVSKDVETGVHLSEAMSRYKSIFPGLFCQMIKAGEIGGVLTKTLKQVAAHYQRQDEINRKIKNALYYPLLVLVVGLVIITFLIITIIPQFSSIFTSFGIKLPLPTRVLIGVSQHLKTYWLFYLITIVGGLIFSKKQLGLRQVRRKVDNLLLKIPLLGELLKSFYLSRISGVLAVLLGNGITILPALEAVKKVAGNQVYIDLMDRSARLIRDGFSLTDIFAESDAIPPLAVQMVEVGEETGAMEEMFKKISFFYDSKMEGSIAGVLSLLEPVMIIILTFFVGFVVLAVVLPMMDLYLFF